MTEQDIIEIRGHHLLRVPDYVKVLRQYPAYLEEEGGSCPDWERTFIKNEINSFGFNEEDNVKNRAIFHRMLKNPNLLVKLIDDYDALCSDCSQRPKKEEEQGPNSCNIKLNAVQDDRETLGKLGFKIGKTYTSREVLDKVFTRFNLTWYWS